MRLLRGRVCIRPDVIARSPLGIWLPQADDGKKRGVKEARTGVVIAAGPPALSRKRRREVAQGFQPGDRVVYVYGQIDAALPGEPHTAWCSQEEVLAVIE
jgi:co-chaperonin GroES (HSP10)